MIVRSPYPEIEIPAQTITSFVLERARSHGDQLAYVDGQSGRTMTCGELVEAVEQASAGLVERGLRKGDVCMLYSPNSLE